MKIFLTLSFILLTINSKSQNIPKLIPSSFLRNSDVGKKCCNDNDMYFFKGKNLYITGINKCLASGCIEVLIDTTFYYVDAWEIDWTNIIPLDDFKNLTDSQMYLLKTNTYQKALNDRLLYDKKRIYLKDSMDRVQESIDRAKDSIEKVNKLRFSNAKLKGLVLTNFTIFDESEYTKGTGCSFIAYNTSNKIVKYIWVSIIGINPVGDAVMDLAKTTKIVKCVGPILTSTTGTYEFNYVWHTDLVVSYRVSKIRIQYMDGTFKEITNPKSVIFTDSNF